MNLPGSSWQQVLVPLLLFLLGLVVSPAGAQTGILRYVNAPITPVAVSNLSSISAIVNTLSDYRQNRGHHFAFNFTTVMNGISPTTCYLNPAILGFMRSHDSFLTFYVRSCLTSSGGIRLAAQAAGSGQTPPLAQAVFSGASQAPSYPTNPQQYSSPSDWE